MEERGAGGCWEGFSRESAQEKGRDSTKRGVWRTPAAGVVALLSPSNARIGDQQQMIWGEQMIWGGCSPCTKSGTVMHLRQQPHIHSDSPHPSHKSLPSGPRAEAYVAPSDRYAVVPNGSRPAPTEGEGEESVVPCMGPSDAGPPFKKQR